MTEVNDAPEGVSDDTDVALTQDAAADTPAPEADSGDDAAAAADEGQAPAKPKKTAQERIDELTAARRQAERDAEYWREQAMRPPTQPAPQTPQAQTDGRPDPTAYAEGIYDPQYVEDLAGWKADQAVEKRLTEREARTRVETALETFGRRVAEQYPDGEPAGITALRRAPSLPETMFDLITASEIGPKLADHLGSNMREFERISALPPHHQGRELARIEASLAAPAPTPAKTATDAPAPTPQVRGSGGRFTVAPDTSDFAAFEKQYGA